MKAVVMLTVANIGHMSHIHSESTFWCFFPPQEVCSRASAWATIRIGRDGVFTHRNFLIFFCSEALTHRSFYTVKLFHETILRTENVSNGRCCAQKLLHPGAYRHRSFKQEFLHRSFYAQELANTEVFTHSNFYTQKLLNREVFKHRIFYTHKLLHT